MRCGGSSIGEPALQDAPATTSGPRNRGPEIETRTRTEKKTILWVRRERAGLTQRIERERLFVALRRSGRGSNR